MAGRTQLMILSYLSIESHFACCHQIIAPSPGFVYASVAKRPMNLLTTVMLHVVVHVLARR